MAAAKEFPPEKIRSIAVEVASLLKERKETVSLHTGVTHCIRRLTQETKTGYKGPTTDIVAGLATNVRPKLGATYCVSESGTAGPTGGNTPNRTPGYVALAVATESGTYKRELSTGHGGDREANMIQFAVEGLVLLRDVIKGDAKL
ncbi:hypothetical protein LOCC1_G007396 [Lachnellula occidentalis]|uniref:CinA C-terminal domain-containing protein n=1 Tax=Lachnellula occidentalis TaxID=215460 RepID=A0A8H8RMT1_9HELO|nr:hypothetical protein LOCC1_G007396 [Lachnellula occidentalis]